MTHDVKNLLQSLNVLVSAAGQQTGLGHSPELLPLIQRQLPVIAKRLSATLEKLQRPQTEQEEFVPVEAWWEGLKRQYLQNGVEFRAQSIEPGSMLPRALAESVADNLIQNALAKKGADSQVRIRVSIAGNGSVDFRVTDTGHAVGSDIEKLLFHAPVGSHSGLGIGLYQAARHAEANGFSLSLASNRDGEVTFSLSGVPRPARAG